MVRTGITFTFIVYIITIQPRWMNMERNRNIHSVESVIRNLQHFHGLDSYKALSVTKFPAFYGTCRFITFFTESCQWLWYWATWIQSTVSQPILLRFIHLYITQDVLKVTLLIYCEVLNFVQQCAKQFVGDVEGVMNMVDHSFNVFYSSLSLSDGGWL